MLSASLRCIAVALLVALVPLYSEADDLPQVYTKNTERFVKGDAPLPLVLQVGLDAGLLKNSTTIPREGPFSGAVFAGKTLASFLFEDWILEAGLGWSYSSLYGTTKGENPAVPELGHRVYTQSAFAEAGLRFRLTPRVNLGLIVQDYFGTDLTLSQRQGLVNNMLLGGGMFAIDLLKESGIFRLGAFLLAEIPDNKRQVVNYGATLQFGIPLRNYDIMMRKTDIYVRRERVQKVEVSKVVTKTIVRDLTKYSLPVESFRFYKNQTALNPEDQEFISELGQTLKQVSPYYKLVTVEVTVPETSDPRRDQKISELRALSIRNAIVSAGHMPAQRILARGEGGRQGFAETSPGSTSKTFVDLSFLGLTNPDAVTDALNQLLKRRSTPETCRGERCK
jgi:outer membrane protein OmpA-like peptidoglycan-associated protein